jgi:two-component system response regulator
VPPKHLSRGSIHAGFLRNLCAKRDRNRLTPCDVPIVKHNGLGLNMRNDSNLFDVFERLQRNKTTKSQVWEWALCQALSTDTAAALRLRQRLIKAQSSTRVWETGPPLTESSVDILLIEDNPQDVRLVLDAFQRVGVASRIHVARDGEAALRFFFGADAGGNSNRANAIVLDLTLPKIDGLEVLHRLKAERLTQAIPVIVLISCLEEREVVESYGLEVSSYIVKPLDFDQFTVAIRQTGLNCLAKHSDEVSESAHSGWPCAAAR